VAGEPAASPRFRIAMVATIVVLTAGIVWLLVWAIRAVM
jgi:hypothetical protein